MSNGRRYTRIPLGPILLIGLGLVFFYAQVRPEFNPWPFLSRYWPVLLIVWGLAKLSDYFRLRSDPQAPRTAWITGGEVCILIVVLLLGAALSRKDTRSAAIHEAQSVERGTAESVRVDLKMGAGGLKVSGGASKLLEADFHYDRPDLKPRISYSVAGSQGRLTVEQESSTGIHFGRTENDWNLRLNNDAPMEMNVKLGAGQSDLRLSGLSLTRLDVDMGAGQIDLDLTGDWKQDLDVDIEGGVGSASVRVPREVGVRVEASGGIGSINISGLQREGGYYVNEEYGKSPVTLKVRIKGGIGEINVRPGP